MREDKTTRKIIDNVLELFNERGRIDKSIIGSDPGLMYYNEIMEFLESEGLLKETPYYFEITYKGRLKVDDGGFTGSFRRERRALFWSCFAAIVSFAAAVASIVALIFAVAK